MFYCERSQVSITRSVAKACENIKLAYAFTTSVADIQRS